MTKKKSFVTAEELHKELQKDEAYQKMIAQKEKESQELDKKLAEDEKPLVNDLHKIKIPVSSVWDLVNSNSSYPSAVPVLISHLSKNYHEKTKEGIIRSLAVREAKGIAGAALIQEFYRIPKENINLRWTIGSTLDVVIAEDDVEEVLKIVQDKTNGISRQYFISALGKIQSKKAEKVLIDLLNDEQVVSHALEVLGNLKSKIAKDKITSLLNNSNLKKEAQKALKKIG